MTDERLQRARLIAGNTKSLIDYRREQYPEDDQIDVARNPLVCIPVQNVRLLIEAVLYSADLAAEREAMQRRAEAAEANWRAACDEIEQLRKSRG